MDNKSQHCDFTVVIILDELYPKLYIILQWLEKRGLRVLFTRKFEIVPQKIQVKEP